MFFDCHTHTTNSDGKATVDELCAAALTVGLSGVIITDHANMNYYNERSTYESMLQSIRDTEDAAKKYGKNLKVLRGMELGEYTVAPKKAKEVLALNSFDAILCAVHFVPQAGWSVPYNRIDFQNSMLKDEEINEYLEYYFDLLSETVDAFDFDILAHIHCPVRYISGKWGRKCNIMLFEDKISEILEKIVKRNIALELNTSRMINGDGSYNFSLDKILTMYKDLGGKMVTLGSDAHSATSVGKNFKEAVPLLKSCGFNSLYYFENRQPKEYFI